MKKKNGGNSLWDLRRTMKTRRVICNSGPASQFTYVNQFIAFRTRNVSKAYLSPDRCATSILAVPCRFYEFSLLYLLSWAAAFGAAQGHRVATISNYHRLFCSSGRIVGRRVVDLDCAVQPSQRHNGEHNFQYLVHWGSLLRANFCACEVYA